MILLITFENFFKSLNIFSLIMIGISIIIFTFYLFLRKIRINGIVVMALSLLLFIVSMISKDIFLQFLSFAVLFIFDFIFIYYIIILFYYLNKEILLNTINHGILHPMINYSIDIEADRLPFSFPGIHFLLKLNIYEFNDIIKENYSLVTYKNKNAIYIEVNFPRHGNFLFKDITFVFRDIFGFTEFKMKINNEYNIFVYPYFIESINIPFFLDKGGEEVLQSKVKVNSTDFFENRKYYPGDDTRRINWKIFAHTKELHVREVEKIPPKIGQISILYTPYSKNLYEYEYISSIFLATVNYLLKNDFQIKIFSPCNLNAVVIDKSAEKEFNHIVANSYKPYMNTSIDINDKPIVFASFEEYNKLITYPFLNKCFCAVTYYEETIEHNYLKTILQINKYDNFIKEIFININNLKMKEFKEKHLKEIEEISIRKSIELNLYRISYETGNIFK